MITPIIESSLVLYLFSNFSYFFAICSNFLFSLVILDDIVLYWYPEWKIIEIMRDGVFPQGSLISFDRKRELLQITLI